ncbi:DNA endonuclease SmrA [Aestuariirhabdus sp. Z084]|uniref:DNA endonuclease SmrA n=1 Tax=Aestuariirhabdus haliotis TaxID=2918751 RepID=UPI00201B3A67|nr:DNA endonuclease SmrA [Aestuariirhabdus haliotis]MCL6416525.1 DNA endonuclease SmrA [Aestuariirhabdus haliotis]MCL6420515.1 DNA endonuclease SmrA [Aestuariirhabdus haliotis]
MQDSNDAELFSQEVSDVAPLETKRAHLSKTTKSPSLAQQARKLNAQSTPEQRMGLSSSVVAQVHPRDVLEFKRPGLQDGVYRKLRLGKYPIEATIDLHRLTLAQGQRELERFIHDCYQYGLRTVTINHGRGERDPENPARMKSHVAHWLHQMDQVLAYHSAQQHHGGSGVLYVLIRKAEAQKQKNRERFRMR